MTTKAEKARKRVRRFCSSKTFRKARNKRVMARWLKRAERICDNNN